MKLLAQHGFADGEKTKEGLSDGFIEGVTFSAKDIALPKLQNCILEHRAINSQSFLASRAVWPDDEGGAPIGGAKLHV